MSENDARNAMLGKTIKNVIYELDRGREKMHLIFDGFSVTFEPVQTPGTDHLHLGHRITAVKDIG